MILHRNNFEIPARFVFRPFRARWEIRRAELMGWVEMPKSLLGGLGRPERERVSVCIVGAGATSLGALRLHPSSPTVEMYRADIPGDVLAPHESPQTAPDISGRSFPVLVCTRPEFKTLFPSAKPGDAVKNARAMLDEFLNVDPVTVMDWLLALQRFLNRWWLWNHGYGFHIGLLGGAEMPGFVLAFPHLLWEKREEYRKARESKNARKWLSTALPLSFSPIDKPPYFLVERFYCDDAIQATITIDHLAKRRFGFCKRCGKQFEQETEHKKNYCSRQCIQADGVKRWRDNQRKELRKGVKRNAKS